MESSSVRPRQARYQAALRPDITFTIDSTALCVLVHNDWLQYVVGLGARYIFSGQVADRTVSRNLAAQ